MAIIRIGKDTIITHVECEGDARYILAEDTDVSSVTEYAPHDDAEGTILWHVGRRYGLSYEMPEDNGWSGAFYAVYSDGDEVMWRGSAADARELIQKDPTIIGWRMR